MPLEEQAHTLALMGEYSEALALAALLEDKEMTEVAQVSGRVPAGGEGEETATAAGVGGGDDGGDRAGHGYSTCSGRGYSRRELLEERLRLAYGHFLFQEGEYDEGMAQLALCK